MFRILDSQEVIDKIRNGAFPEEVDRGYIPGYIHLTYYMMSENRADLVVVVGDEGFRQKTIHVAEFNLLEDNIRDYTPEARKLKGKLQRYFKYGVTVTSDFRWN